MSKHHKSNKRVEGDPYSGHGHGMPRRPDEDELAVRTDLERLAAGLPPEPDLAPGETENVDLPSEGEEPR